MKNKKNVAPTGFIHGRFQVLHNDHLTYLLAGKKRCKHLVVGISNPDPTLTKTDTADALRSSTQANPLSYYERYLMVRAVLTDADLRLDDFSIVPFPVNFPDLYRYYIPMNAVFYLTIYDAWGEKKLKMFKALGLNTEILWQRPKEEKGLSSTEVRRRIVSNQEWQPLVPTAVVRLAKEFNLRERFAGTEKNPIDKR